MTGGQNIRKKLYKAFGFIISSDMDIPELIEAHEKPEINIVVGKVPCAAEKLASRNRFFYAEQNKALLKADGIGKFYVENGNLIIAEPEDFERMNLVRLVLLGTVFGLLLLQRNILPIHGSGIVLNGKCIIFTGRSGAGKSTISSAFREMGCEFLSDDITAIKLDQNGIPRAQPGYPLQKLRRDSLIYLDEKIEFLTQIHKDIDKYYIPVHNSFVQDSAELAAVFELQPDSVKQVEVIKLSGSDKLKMLMRNTYRSSFVNWMGLEAIHFNQCHQIAGSCCAYRITRPNGKFSVEEQVNAVLRVLRKESDLLEMQVV